MYLFIYIKPYFFNEKNCYQHGYVILICLLLLFVFMLACPDRAMGTPLPQVPTSLLSGITSCSRHTLCFLYPRPGISYLSKTWFFIMQNGFLEAKILVLDALIAVSVVTSMFSYQCIELWKICRYTHTVTHPLTTSVFISPCVCIKWWVHSSIHNLNLTSQGPF